MTEHELAVHEAGHALAAFALGHPLNAAEIRPDGGRVITGCVGERLAPAALVAALEAFDAPVRDRVLRERVWIALAGDAAVAVLQGRAHWNGESDAPAIHAFSMRLEVAPWVTFPRVLACVRASWAAVDALAVELELLRRLEGPRIEELLALHIERGAWRTEVNT